MVQLNSLTGAAVRAAAVAGALFTAIAHAQQTPPGAPASGNGMLAGRVVDADSGEGIAGATISMGMVRTGPGLTGGAARYAPVLTDSQGRFVFTILQPGPHSASVEREGYAQVSGGRTIDLEAGARVTDFNFRLTKFNTVLGTVRDDVGDPVVGTDVLAFVRTATQGRPPTLTVRARGRSDDRGQYRLNNLAAGQYVICACTRDVIPLDGQFLSTLAARPLDLLSVARRAAAAGSDVASLDSTLRTYAPTFYPNTPLASRAERVKVEKGETRASVDITLATVRAVRVSGQIIGLPPSSISAASMRLTAVGDVPEAAAITQLPPMLVQPDGRFDFSGVAPGTYVLDVNAVAGRGANSPSGSALAFLGTRAAPGPPPPPPPPPPPGGRGSAVAPDEILWAMETIVVGDEDVTGLVIPIQRGVTVRGTVEFAGAASPPQANTLRGVVQLAAMEPRPNRPSAYGSQINPDGTFTWIVPPGRYVIPAAPSLAAPWSNVRSITAKGVSVLDVPMVIDGDITDMVVTMTDAPPSSLLGTVELPAGESPEDWAVLVFPADKRLWKEPFASVRRFVTARVSSQRTFTPRVPPGEYLIALSRDIPPDWVEASALEELAKGATSVTVAESEKKAVQVRR
ncbi:MAG TPA: carboxypeptidase-like regulatory domain-containing protein [Vicinamibacterales bacterium]|nr:carboxypeptidase-like regulatory domain-containing protein [Vicinamibacterales bacterium]